MAETTTKGAKTFDRIMRAAFASSGGALIIVALWIWGRQAYQKARFGEHDQVTTIDLLASIQSMLGAEWRWLRWPEDWIGVHSFLAWAPGAVALALLGWALLAIACAD